MKRGKSASLPPRGWSPPQSLDQNALTYAATVDNSPEPYLIDGSDWGAPRQLVIDLLSGIQRLVEIEGRWRQRATVQKNAKMTEAFARWIGQWDDPNVTQMNQPQEVADLTPGVWAAYALSLGAGQAGRRNQLQLALILKATGMLTEDAALRVLARKGSFENGNVEHYSNEEFRAIVAASKRAVRLAHERITANYSAALFAEGHTGDPTRESILFEMLTTTCPRSKTKARILGTVRHHTWPNNVRGTLESGVSILIERARGMLYPTQSESFAAMVLLIALRGLNLSQVQTMKIPDRTVDAGEELAQVSTDKPRRGPHRRFSLEVFGDSGDDTDGRWLRRMEEMTDPLRHHLRIIGKENHLLILHMAMGKVSNSVPGSSARVEMDWAVGLATIDCQRLKRTFETRHSRESTQNTEATHISVYIRRDPERIAEYQDLAAEGIERAARRALDEVQLKFVDDESFEVVKSVDSAFASCLDPEHEPRTGLPCQDGFLGCLSCPNAIATDRHLPLMRYTLDLLEEIRASVPDSQWVNRFALAHAQLSHVLDSAPVSPYAKRVTNRQRDLIRLALGLQGETS